MASEGGGEQATKMARNRTLWRQVNERIRAVAETSVVGLLCECARVDCTATLNMSMAEYERIRSSPVRFPIALGHDFPDVESIVEQTEHYAVVQKRGEAAE
jgi:hypothetical protein